MALEIENRSINNQYELLNILDSKASALLSFNSIFLASISIWLGYVPANTLHFLLDLVFIALLVSCWYLLRVIWLAWTRLDEIEGQAPEVVTEALNGIRQFRTTCYQRAWRISSICIVAVVVISVFHAIGTGLQATSRCGKLCQSIFDQSVFGNLDIGENT